MKKFIFLLAIGLSSVSAIAQPNVNGYLKPFTNQFEAVYQLVSPVNVYSNTPTPSNAGSQVDTLTNTGTVLLQICSLGKGLLNADTFTAKNINGAGQISFTTVIYKCTGTATVICQPQSSVDGINWGNIPGVSAYSVVPTSLTVPVVNKTYLTAKQDRYYGILCTGVGTQTSSAQAWLLWQCPQSTIVK